MPPHKPLDASPILIDRPRNEMLISGSDGQLFEK